MSDHPSKPDDDAPVSPWANSRPRMQRDSKTERMRARQQETSPAARPHAAPPARTSPAAPVAPVAPRGSSTPWSREEAPRTAEPRAEHPRSAALAPTEPYAPRAATYVPPANPEMRLYGVNACLGAFAQRPQELRKVYLTEARLPELKAVLAWCAQHKIGYRIVGDSDLVKLSGSRHHEGVCFDMLRRAPLDLAELLESVPEAPGPSLLLWLDGVGNPYNLGALLRSAAHFGVGGVIVPARSSLDLSGAAARVAEGGAEHVPLVRIDNDVATAASLRDAGYALAATVPRAATPLYESALPRRLVLVFGAEGEGMSEALIAAADVALMIPGSGVVESLNIAASAAIVLGEYWRQHGNAR